MKSEKIANLLLMYYNLLQLGVKRNILNNISYKKYLFQNSKS
jgi:hypothetical protein